MRTKEDITATVSKLLTDVRTKKGFSKTKMAEYLGIDKHTWIRWESGANSPSLEDVIMIFDQLDEPILPALLDILYPSGNFTHNNNTTINDVRKSAALYFLETSTEHQVRVWDYMIRSLSRTEMHAQIEEFCALDHLPLHMRYFVAEQIYIYYMTALNHGQIINENNTMPDMDTFTAGLIRNQKQAFDTLKLT